MRKILYLISLVCLAACSTDEVMPDMDASGFVLSLTDDATVTTRMTPAELGAPVAGMFSLRVENSTTGRVVYDDRFTEFVTAPDGTYTLTATCGEDVPLGIDCPYYKGVATATITVDDTKPAVTIPCRVANALLSVRYLDRDGNVSTSRFDEFFTTYRIVVSRGNMSVDLTDASRSAYFRAGDTPRMTFVGTLAADNGREVTFDITSNDIPATLDAADHLVLNLSVQVAPSGVILDVQKATVNQVTIEETIPLEWLPAPKVGFAGDAEQMRYEDDAMPNDKVFTINTSHDLQDMEIVVDSDDPAMAALNGTYTLSTMTEEQRTMLTTAGIVLLEIGQAYTDYAMDFNEFVGALATDEGKVTHTSIGVRVKANNRWSDESPVSCAFTVKRLRFTLPEQVETDAWSHTLYINPVTADDIVVGEDVDKESVLANIIYEVSADGETWTVLDVVADGVQLVASTLTPGTTYQLRARLDGSSLSSNTATQTMEEATQVPNGDFEDLRQTLNVEKLNAGNDYAVNVSIFKYNYQNTATFTISEPTGWASVNNKTCNVNLCTTKYTWYAMPSTYNTTLTWKQFIDFRKSTQTNPEPYNNLSAQSGSNAMVIRNVGWDHNGSTVARTGGSMNTNYYNTNVPNVAQRSSGKLFLGSYAYTDGTEVYNEGVDFASRPTSLGGYFKYALDGDDSEHGTVSVALLNGDNIVAEGNGEFAAQGNYAAFDVPLSYVTTSVRPTTLRIMFTSSRYASYTQADETANVKAATHNGEYESCMRGATLAIDNLTFTYDK